MASSSGNAELDNKIQEWLAWDQNPITLKVINDHVANKNFVELEKILLGRIAFGTAGLRGRMEAGYTGMNDLVIIQTAQGLMRHLETTMKDRLKSHGIVYGYDGRHNSKRWAELSAAIFLYGDYPVYLFETVVPTPFVPFSVSILKCVAGVMVTASHNPKDDNGYKVYGANGSQIISPADESIHSNIIANLTPWPTSWDTNILKTSTILHRPLLTIIDSYVHVVSTSILDEYKQANSKTNLKFTYTAMHGVGYNYIVKVLDAVNISVIPVVEQRDPDPEFPTVKFPNPEEGKSALDLSFKTADKNNSTIIIANDPDADRLAVAEKDSSGNWRIFNGNELGALLGWWCLHCYKAKETKAPMSDCYMISSTVSSKILKSICNAENLNFVETLTGFKWIGNKAHELLLQKKTVIFAFEEAIGFMCGSEVLDKDGINAAVYVATMAVYLEQQQLTLGQQLQEIYKEYGYHLSNNSYFICNDPILIVKIFERLRNFDGPKTYPKHILNNKYSICNVRDLTTGYDDSQPNNKAILPVSASTQMITFDFNNGLVVTIRTSGTEPKIKYYSELCASPSQKDENLIKATLEEMIDAIILEFLEPAKNGLISKSD